MALAIKSRSVLGDCTSLLVYDKTGIYSAIPPVNTSGFGAPNQTVAMVDTATLTITTAATAIPYVIDAYPTLPNTADTPYEVLPTAIGYTTSIPDQILTVKYGFSGIDGSGTPFTPNPVVCYVPVLCTVECCVTNLLADAGADVFCSCADACSCECNCSEKMMKWMKANLLLESIKSLAASRQYNMAVYNLNLLKALCACP